MSELLDAALRYRPRSIPLHPRSKRPFGKGWQHRTWTADELRAHWDRWPGANVGLLTGDRLAVLDIDPRAGGAESLAELEAEHGILPTTPTVLSGGIDSGEHRYYRTPPGALASRTIAEGIELKADGRQVVAPPSIHPESGRVYCWDPRRSFEPRQIAPLPHWLLETADAPSSAPATEPHGELAGDPVLLTIPSREYVPALTGREVDRYGYAVCPFHDPSKENPRTLSVNGPRPTLWKCWSDRCQRGGDIYVLAGLLFGIEPPLQGIRWSFVSEQVGQFYERLWGIEPGWGS